jgi:hypothetical protein
MHGCMDAWMHGWVFCSVIVGRASAQVRLLVFSFMHYIATGTVPCSVPGTLRHSDLVSNQLAIFRPFSQ